MMATICTIYYPVQNMNKGVTPGFCYKKRSVYTQFLTKIVTENGSLVETHNFLDGKYICRVWMQSSIACSASQVQKDELIFLRS